MTNQDKKAELKKYRDLNRAINQKQAEYEQIKAMCTKRVTSFSDMPKAPGIKSREEAYIKLADLAAEINSDIDCYVDMGRRLERAIRTVDDASLQTLLRCRYIYGLGWSKIAVRIHRTLPMTKIKLHDRAVESIKSDNRNMLW